MNLKSNKNQQAVLFISLLFVSIPANTATFQNYDHIFTQEPENYRLFDDLNKNDSINSLEQQLPTSLIDNQQLILSLIDQNKYDQALAEINKNIKLIPNNVALYKLKAVIETYKKDILAAEKSYQKVIELDNKNLLAFESLSKLKFDAKDYINARAYAEKALEINPHSIISYQILADLTEKTQGINVAELFLLDAKKNVVDNFEAELSIIKILNNIYSRKKLPKKQLQQAENLVSRYQNNSKALSLLSGALIINQNFDAAEKIMRQLILQQPNEGKHLLALARLLGGQKGKEIETFELLDRAEKNLNNPTLALALKTTLHINLKQYKQALTLANHIIKTYPGQSVGKLLKGNVLYSQKKHDSATLAYQEAYKMTPTISNMDLILKGLAVQRKAQDAKYFLQQEILKKPDNPLIQYRLAEANQKTGDFQSAISLYEKLLSKKADDALLLNNLAWAYGDAKDITMALKTSTKAYKIAPQSSAIADTHGYFLLANGQNKKALSILKLASAISPQLKEIQLHLAQAYIANGENNEAQKILVHLAKEKSSVQAIASKLLKH